MTVGYRQKIKNIAAIGIGLVWMHGCGQESSNIPSNMQIPQSHDSSKSLRALAEDKTDWTWSVGVDANRSEKDLGFDIYFMQGIPTAVKHFQYFLDTDSNINTGFSFGKDGWRISGADYLLEDGKLYKSTSNKGWHWEYVDTFEVYDRLQEDGIEHIHIATKKMPLVSLFKSDFVHVTIEPFDKDWTSTYSTISEQFVSLADEDDGESVMILDGKKEVSNLVLHDATPAGAFTEYIEDDALQDSAFAVQTHTSGIANSFHFVGYDTTKEYQWYEMPQYQNKMFISWDGKFEEDYIVYVVLKFKTEKGETKRSDLVYTPSKKDYKDYTENFMHIYLGNNAKDGRWHHYKRNILEDLRRFYPGATIDYADNFSGYVNGFALRGSGRITNIKLSTR